MSNDATLPHTEPSHGSRWPLRLVVAAAAFLALFGLFGWAVMGQSLYFSMVTGLGWLCM